jgi:hypothetical protein
VRRLRLMAGKKLSEVAQGEMVGWALLKHTENGRNAQYVVEMLRIGSGLVVRTKWGAIGANPRVKDYREATSSAAGNCYTSKIQKQEAGGYKLVSGPRGFSHSELESTSEKAARTAQEDARKQANAARMRELAMGAMGRAAAMAEAVVPQIIEGEEVYDEV